VGLPAGVGISAILPSAVSGTIYAIAGQSGLYRTISPGPFWWSVPTSLGQNQMTAVLQGNTAQVLYLSSLGGGFIASSNSGQTWTPALTPTTVDTVTNVVIVDPVNPLMLFAATGGDGVLKSLDGGQSWQPAVTGLTQLYITALVMDPTNHNVLYAGAAQGGVFRTADGGTTWSPLQNGLSDPNVVSLAVDSINHNIVYAGTEGGGVFRIQIQ
jgi:photosystem II stability/assembly factor-like uncharacterized protein